MKDKNIISYENLKNDTWTVQNLKYKNNVKKNRDPRLKLNNFTRFNTYNANYNAHPNKKFKYVEISNIDPKTNLIDDYSLKTAEEMPARAKLKAQEGYILFPKIRPNSGAVAYCDDEYIVSDTLVVLMVEERFSSALLYFILSSKQVIEEIDKLTKGNVVPSLTLGDLKNYFLPLDSYPKNREQEAEKLLKRWLKLNKEKMNLKKAADTILTKHIFDNKDINNVKLKELIKFKKPYKQYLDKLKEKDQPIIKNKHLDEYKINVDYSNLKENHWKKSNLNKNKYLKNNWIVLPKEITNINKTNILTNNLTGALIDRHLYTLETSDKLDPEYLVVLFKSSWLEEKLSDYDKRTISQKNIKNLEIPLPDINKQKEVVKSVKGLSKTEEIKKHKMKIGKFKNSLFKNKKGV